MKALKFSRQRESIRECLKNRKDHPTADAVYVTISKDTRRSVWELYTAT